MDDFYEKVRLIAEKYGYQARKEPGGDAVEIMNGPERLCTVGGNFGIMRSISPQILDMVAEICEVQAGLNSEVKLEDANVSEPSIIPYFREVTRLAEEQGLTTALNDGSHSILDVYLGDLCIANVDGYSGAVMYSPYDEIKSILDDIGNARLRIPFESDEAREKERLAALDTLDFEAVQDEPLAMSM